MLSRIAARPLLANNVHPGAAMRIKVQDGTPVSSESSLCCTCRCSTIIRGRTLDEELVFCSALGIHGVQITFTGPPVNGGTSGNTVGGTTSGARNVISGNSRHGVSILGDVKYAPGFPHFDYVNPDAPKGGTLRMSSTGTFDSFNPVLDKGEAAPGLAIVFDTLLKDTSDEISTGYGLLAEGVSYDVVLHWDRDEDWTCDDDERAWSMTIEAAREGVTFDIAEAPIDPAACALFP